VTGASPVVRQRELGARLRGLRNEKGLTVEEVAAQLLCSTTKISRLETAARRPSLRDVRDLCALYEVNEATSVELMGIAREARQPGWWSEYEDLDLDPLIGLEQDAAIITCYSMSYIPGLLQTEEYAQGIIQTVAPKMEAKIVHQRTEARMRRQQLLERDNPPQLEVLLDEVVLRRGVGGPPVMAAQLEKVLKAARSGQAIVQVIPFSAGAYTAMDGYFMLLEFHGDSELRPVVFIEGLSDNKYLERKDDIARYRETIDYLRARSLDQHNSIKLITNVRDAYIKQQSSRS
jgi:transcriptional regulator with XRE-family HTH domain